MIPNNFNILPKVAFEVIENKETNKGFPIKILQFICELTKKVYIVAWDIFSVIVFPIGLIRLGISKITPQFILPATAKFNLEMKRQKLNALIAKQKLKPLADNQIAEKEQIEIDINEISQIHKNREIFLNDPTNQAEQITIKTVDGIELDTIKIKNSHSNKWIVYFGPNAECYEKIMEGLKEISEKTGANVYTGNYRGVMRSHGAIQSTNDMVLDGKAMVQKLLSEGIPEEDMLIHGHSIGGAVATEVASLYPKVHHCSDRSFASLSHFLKGWVPIIGGVLGGIAGLAGWKFNSVTDFEIIQGKKFVIYSKRDWVIPFKASLYNVLKNKNVFPESVEVADNYIGDDYIENWIKNHPSVNKIDAQVLAKKGFEKLVGLMDHCCPLRELDIYESYIDFVKNALHLSN
ncbi:MAG: alpha/beta hydrolase [Parachlamydiaceae bacterium]|nr:alpha/beta hydrolase [Parachlamydiaceae bacterium]